MRVVAALLLVLTSACAPRAADRPPEAPRPAPEPGPEPAAAPGPAADTPTVVRPGAPGEASRVVGADRLAPDEPAPWVEADARFMQGMIVHHAQALVMTDLAPERTESQDLLSAAGRIETSQVDEIAWMARWLQERDLQVPDPPTTWDEWRRREHPGGHAGHGIMPGMASNEAMRRLAGARGEDFDRLFLELMIDHHAGALVMVDELFGAEGAGAGPEIYLFASDVDADQRAEIARMQRMLESRLQRGGR